MTMSMHVCKPKIARIVYKPRTYIYIREKEGVRWSSFYNHAIQIKEEVEKNLYSKFKPQNCVSLFLQKKPNNSTIFLYY